MKSSVLRRFLTGPKLKFDQEEGRHIQFTPRISGKEVKLPNLICMPRSSGELPNPVFGSVARGLGLRESDLKAGIGCNLGRDCILLCLVIMLLTKCQDDPVAFKPDAYLPMVSLFVEEAEKCLDTAKKWNNAENKALFRHRQTLELLKNNHIIMPLAIRVIGIVAKKH